ncbi:hypothetical protein RRG08_047992 [Elysia crispata]|uniref:Uncharacterized protein n=1 Tax=Elysia crispata TaxID=231223 RepID=A0AAE0ZUK2_9GAST|nr:hypothetical protein RRG08_047992 [Elysia crispata]
MLFMPDVRVSLNNSSKGELDLDRSLSALASAMKFETRFVFSPTKRCGMALGRSRMWQQMCVWRNYIILVVTPIVCAPILAIGTSESRCAYPVMLMAVFWFSEAMPVGVTALLPVVLFPLLDVVKSSDISKVYMTDTNMMLFGSMLVAVSIEYWDIHKRIALRVLMVVGSEPRWLMLGLMLATWVLSMWISNMATAAMMIPITEAVLQQLEDCSAMEKGRPASIENDSSQHSGSKNGVGVCGTLGSNEAFDDPEKDTAETPLHTLQPNASTQAFITSSVSHGINGFHNADICDEALDLELGQGEHTKPANFAGLSKGMSLCICYAANIGGVATLTGTGPNMIMKGNTDRLYKAADERNPINFGSWMGFAIPLSLILLLLCWVWLQLAFFDRGSLTKRGVRHDPTTSKRIRRLIQEEYNKLGPLVFGQILVLVMFVVLVILWITRDIGGVAGWGRHFKSVSNSLPGILVGILMFALPSSMSCVRSCSGESQPEKLGASTDQKDNAPGARVKPLMNWEYMNRKMPWQLVLLLGGGFAISEGFVKSGLSVWIGDQLYFFRAWNEWLVLLVFCFITASATELASNNAICSVLLPIMEELAPRIGAHPLLFIIPVTLSTSFAFMLPVATPTNAIVFTYGRLKTMDMAKAGLILNLASVPCTVIMTKTLGAAIFDLGEVPEQFLQNATALVATP